MRQPRNLLFVRLLMLIFALFVLFLNVGFVHNNIAEAVSSTPREAKVLLGVMNATMPKRSVAQYSIDGINVLNDTTYVYSSPMSLKFGASGSGIALAWIDWKKDGYLNLSEYVDSLDELAISFWVYVEDASSEADLQIRLRDSTDKSAYFRNLKKTDMAPTAFEWHNVLLRLSNGEIQEGFNWKSVWQFTLQTSSGDPYTMWINDPCFVKYPTSPYNMVCLLDSCDTKTSEFQYASIQSHTVYDGTGAIKMSPPETEKASIEYASDVAFELGEFARSPNELGLSFWAYTDTTGEDVSFTIDLVSGASWGDPKISYTIPKDDIAGQPGKWHHVVIPFSEFTSVDGTFDLKTFYQWRFTQSADAEEYTLYLDDIGIVSLIPQISGINFASTVKVDLTKAFSQSPVVIEGWIQVMPPERGDPNPVGVIIGNTADLPRPGDGSISLSIAKEGRPRLIWNGGQKDILFDVDVRTGDWLHIAVVRDMNSKQFILYIDGVEFDRADAAGTTDAISATPYVIGSDLRGFEKGAVFNGKVWNLRVWNLLRSGEEISSTKRLLLESTEPGLMGNWWLDESYHAEVNALDRSLFENHGVFKQDSEWLTFEGSGEFSLVAIPDTQILARTNSELITMIMQWIKENKVEENIQYVLALGDIVDDSGSVKQWENAKSSYALLEGVLPVSHVLGNHEYDNLTDLRSTRNFNTYFPYPDDMPTLGGVYEDGIADNSFHRFTVDGINYMILALEFFPRDAVLEWACQVVEQYPEDNVIVTTHAFLDGYDFYVCFRHLFYPFPRFKTPHYFRITQVLKNLPKFPFQICSCHSTILL